MRIKMFVAALIVIAGFGWYREGTALYQSSDRVEQWKFLLSWWWDNANLLFGTGTGSFDWLSPQIQGPERTKTGFFVMMHNDYLQVLFEQGIIGLLLIGSVWVQAVYRSVNRPWLFATLLGFSFCFVTQFPLRYFLSQFLIGLLVMEAIDE